MQFKEEEIAKATGISLENITQTWPIIYQAMVDNNHFDALEQIAIIATIAVETNIYSNHKNMGFLPITELGNDSYFEEHYGYNTKTGQNLGNTSPGDGAKYCGRGFIQITGKANYQRMMDRFNVDFINNPELALNTDDATKIAISYFNDRKIWDQAMTQNWHNVRVRVNGGTNGWTYFKNVIDQLMTTLQSYM